MSQQIDLDFIKQDFYRKKLREFLEILFESSTKITVTGVLLYGSLARGEAKENNLSSDIDVILVSKNLPKDYYKRRKKVKPIMENTSAYIEPLWWTPKEMETHVTSFI